jgi:tetratricopeptide (TPR) repeat protein
MAEETDQLTRLKAALAERYRVERELGHGGMATVYLAEDLKHHRLVALKVLRPELGAALGSERFLREIAVTARLNHPHILALLDSGEAGGFVYYAMPYVEGESLRERLNREKQLPLDEALQIAREVADALSYAHSRDVVHRDIKPENILLESGHAVVADFGIARAITAAGGERLTETGIAVGTPAYMSPEQATGSQGLDGRTDLYSLGCVLFEMLAGRPPFVGPTSESIVRQHLAAGPPSLSSIRAGVPPRISEAIGRALAKAPADRFASTGKLATALSASAPVSHPRPRRRTVFVSVGAVAVVLALALTLTLQRLTHQPALPRVLVRPFVNLTGQPALDPIGQAVSQSVVDGLAELATLEAAPSGAPSGNDAFIVEGSYRQRGDSIEFVMEIVDQARHRALPAPEPARAPLREPLAGLETIRERAAGALAYYTGVFRASRNPERRPPSYPAYLAFTEALNYVYRLEPDSSEAALRRALELDPTYTEAYMLLAGFTFSAQPGPAERRGGQAGRPAAMDSLARVMRSAVNPLTDADRAVLQALDARARGDLAAGLTAYMGLADLVPPAAFGVVVQAAWLNKPSIAVDRLRRLSFPARAYEREFAPWWTIVAAAYHELGDYQHEDETVRVGLERFPWFAPLREAELRAAIALGHLEDVEAADAQLQPFVALRLALEARTHGHPEEAGRLLAHALHSLGKPSQGESTEDRFARALGLSLEGRQSEAIGILQQLTREDTLRLDSKGMLGVAYARQGDRAAATRMSQAIAAVPDSQLQGLPALWRARIAAVLGDSTAAVDLLHEALAQGTKYDPTFMPGGSFWHSDPAFEGLRGYGPYQTLIRPD